MQRDRFKAIADRYSGLRIAVLGDFCLDRYLEIDPRRQEISIETGLPVHNVVNVRAQPGGAGTILNNLSALGIGAIFPIGFAGEDGEGFELLRALEQQPGVRLSHFLKTRERRTFTYCKPLVMAPGKAPQELNRLDSKNWSPTPATVQEWLAQTFSSLAPSIDAAIVLDQVDVAETGVITRTVLDAIGRVANTRPDLFILADSRRGLRDFPAVTFKMNAAELRTLLGTDHDLVLGEVKEAALTLARKNGRQVFVSLSERGLLGAAPDGKMVHVPALPTRGEIDIVGAGDAVSANLAAATAAGASLGEAMEIASCASSVVIHKLGTTGTASVSEIAELLSP